MQFNRGTVYSSLFALILAASMAGCGNNLTPEESIAKAKELIGKGEFRPALIELSNALQADPSSQEGRWLMGKVAIELGDGAKAEKEIRKALELGQTRQSAQPLLVKSILLQGDLERVVKETASIPEDTANSNKAMIHALRGQALVMQGKLELAKPVLEGALRIEPNSLEALIGMTALHGIKQEFEEARRWVDLAIKVKADSADAWSAKGNLEMALGNLAKAEEAFGNAIKFRRIATLDDAKRALIRVQLKKLAESEKDIDGLRKAGFGKHPYVSYVAGRVAFAQKKFPEAAELFQASHDIDPDNRLNKLYLATSYHILGQQEKALALATNLSGNAPSSVAVKSLLSSIQISRSEFTAARETLNTALAAAPNDASVLNMLVSTALMEGDKAKGLEYASRLVSLAPNSSVAKNQLMLA